MSDRPTLARSLTLTHAVLYGLGVTIGAGIYVLIGGMAGRAGAQAPMAFVLAAGVMALTAASYAELAGRLPVSAGAAAYAGEGLASRLAMNAVGAMTIAVGIISAAAIAIGGAGYLRTFLDLPEPAVVALVVLAMGAVAAWGIKESVTFAGIMTLIEVSGLLLIVAGGLLKPGLGPEIGRALSAPLEPAVWPGILAAGMLAFFAFIGFENLANVAEEVHEPARTLPRAIFLTLLLATALYFLVGAIAVVAVPPAELAASRAPLSLVFERVTRLSPRAFSAIAVIATLNGVIVQIIMVARILYGLAERGSLPAVLGRVSPRTRTPLVATGAVIAATLLLALAFPLEALAEWTSRITLVVFSIVNIALLRLKLTGAPRPHGIFTAPLWVPAAGAVTCAAFLLADLAR
jgi:amino acid transporter